MPTDEETEIEGVHPTKETVCGECRLVFWVAAGPCPTCAMERPSRPCDVVKGGRR